MEKEYRTKSRQTDNLFESILQLETVEECYAFFDDICTVMEIKSIAQRMEVASMLYGKETYHEIAAKTGASTATISRVNRYLHYGSGGYELVLDRLNKGDKDSN